MDKFFEQGEEAMYGINRVIITGDEIAFGVHCYFILYSDGSTQEIRADDADLKKIKPVIINNEFNQMLFKLWKKDFKLWRKEKKRVF